MIQWDHEAVSLKHRPWNITASTPNAIANYLCWAQFSFRFWHFWWMSSVFQCLRTISKPVLSFSLIVGRLYIRISLTTRENTLVARDGKGFMEVAMLLHVLMFWPGTTCAAGGSLGLASGKLPSAHIASYEKGRCCQAPPCGETEWPVVSLSKASVMLEIFTLFLLQFLQIYIYFHLITIKMDNVSWNLDLSFCACLHHFSIVIL